MQLKITYSLQLLQQTYRQYFQLNSIEVHHSRRQYLSNEGFGFGTPGQRQRQYAKFRAARAAESVHEHRVGRISAKYETSLAREDRKK